MTYFVGQVGDGQALARWILEVGTRAAVEITGDPETLLASPLTLEQAQLAIVEHMQLGLAARASRPVSDQTGPRDRVSEARPAWGLMSLVE